MCLYAHPIEIPFLSNRHHLSYVDCMEAKGKIIRSVLCCVVYDSCAQWYAHTYEQFLKVSVVGLGLVFVHLFMFNILCVFMV